MRVYKDGVYVTPLVRDQADEELAKEEFRKQVEREKERLRAAKWWHRFVPKITIKIEKR